MLGGGPSCRPQAALGHGTPYGGVDGPCLAGQQGRVRARLAELREGRDQVPGDALQVLWADAAVAQDRRAVSELAERGCEQGSLLTPGPGLNSRSRPGLIRQTMLANIAAVSVLKAYLT